MTDAPRRAKRRYLIIPFALFGIFFAAYSALWVYGRGIMKDEIAAYIANEESMGRKITYESMKIAGYPYNLRAVLDDFVWEDPGQWTWSGERLNIITLPYDPSRLIFAPRKAQKLVVDGKSYDIDARAINVSLSDMAYAAEANDFTATGEEGVITFNEFRANWDLNDEGGWVLVAGVRQARFVDTAEGMIDLPYMNLALTQGADAMGRITIDSVEGAVSTQTIPKPTLLKAKGQIGLDGLQRPEGNITITARELPALFDLLKTYELMDAEQAQQAINAFSGGSGADSEIPLPLTMRDGQLRMGPIVLGTLDPISF
ncbi:DUF2125 domain-containing protein [Parvularcula sp. LCG005]|uniref:DUF2125 domain-containing protein n=1 Tax=Parvularcula sp. LCG005 TaxID=3078805 RepID=UPI0029427E99|nr:DUF2125 domain-containing protein [Parvularcula sp. LCG005]WOI52867.1 DUF2125 domain-containing protein [Parvularcula sp. LCG005]